MKILATKLRNHLKKEALDENHLVIQLKNVRNNGQSEGCSGFVGNLINGKVVYVNTSALFAGIGPKVYLYREAEDFKDYQGKSNRYAASLGELVTNVLELCEGV